MDDALAKPLAELLATADDRDYVTIDEVNERLPVSLTPEQLDDAMMQLEGAGKGLVVAPPPKPHRLAVKAAERRKKRRAVPRSRRSANDEGTLGAYLHWLSAAPPMGREEERQVVFRRKEAERHILRTVAQTPMAIDEVLRLCSKVRSGNLSVFKVVKELPGVEATGAKAELAELEKTLRNIDKECRRTLDRLDSSRLTEARRTEYNDHLRASRRQAAKALVAMNLERPHVERIARAVRQAAQECADAHSALKKAEPGSREARNAERKLRTLEDRLRTPPARLLRLARSIETAERRARRARDQLLAALGPLVIKFAQGYRGRGLDLEDLVQEGNIGLAIAIDRFDTSRGTRLATLAVHWVRHQIGRAVANKSRTVRLPVHVGQQLHRILRLQRKLLTQTGQLPDPAELAQRLSVPEADVADLLSRVHGSVSLDETLGGDSDTTGLDLLSDPDATTPEAAAEHQSDVVALTELLGVLSERERLVIERRFGLGEHDEHTLQQIGELLLVTRERARQLVNRGIQKLRKAAREQGIELPLPPESRL